METQDPEICRSTIFRLPVKMSPSCRIGSISSVRLAVRPSDGTYSGSQYYKRSSHPENNEDAEMVEWHSCSIKAFLHLKRITTDDRF